MKRAMLIVASSLLALSARAEEACTKEQAKEAVEKICKDVEADADKALETVQTYRFCGSNYVWVQDANVNMVKHPIKPKLNGTSLKENKDDNGKLLFVEFDKSAKANKDGGWVDYVWPKPGAEKATDKISFVKKCGGPKGWIVGSGVWK
ncbi:cache domain-containing protein [Bdellovibrio sp. NC01]|uniref:cache domain-containing protein n=1 Tax=Bdellovibrio sp. NC01 TaxID=2220073 RepID=UPI0011579EA4|nr:cache domain-containing protein [Bdellovibrio sp. NC01]QDK38489.1 chemotaxis protein [Bdellovibrio sp. NC01]